MNEYYVIYAWSDCPFCVKAKELLIDNEKQFSFCLLDESRQLLEMYKAKHGWETVPMIVHNKKSDSGSWESEFIGGYSDLLKSFEGG